MEGICRSTISRLIAFRQAKFILVYTLLVVLVGIHSVFPKVHRSLINVLWYEPPLANLPNCSSDCVSLLAAVEKQPRRQIKAVIHYLVNANTERIACLKKSLKLLHENFLASYPYPIVLFHEHDLQKKEIDALRSSVPRVALHFQVVDIRAPGFELPQPEHTGCRWRIGYRRMCRFQANTVYQQAILSKFDYAWRLDDDSEILSRISYDVFEYMINRGFLYGYTNIQRDSAACVKGKSSPICISTCRCRGHVLYSQRHHFDPSICRYIMVMSSV